MTRKAGTNEMWGWHDRNGYNRLINVSGTMTGLGSSVTAQSVRDAMCGATRCFVNMHELQARASTTISQLTGAEAGFLTASASAGITLSLAGCMTGLSPARIEDLPASPGEKSEVVIQLGHLCGYGAPIETAVALTGATVRPAGQSTLTMDHQLEGALCERTAAALYVVSHHVVHYGQIPLDRFSDICHSKGVPVIVDAASEYDLRGFLKAGADMAIYSAHKFLGGPTGGIVAGAKSLVHAAYLQNMGIGRGMKIGKESIAGAIAAMEDWLDRDHDAVFLKEQDTLATWRNAISDVPGIHAVIVPDPTGNPLSRLQVNVDPVLAGTTAAAFSRALAQGDPAIVVRSHEVELGYFQLDPCNLLPEQAQIVAETLKTVLRAGHEITEQPGDLARARNGGVDGYLSWPGSGQE